MPYPCAICDADLYETDTVAVCSFCGRETPAEYLCPNGHHVCEECQLADPLQVVERVCEGTRKPDPGAVVNLIMKHPCDFSRRNEECKREGCQYYEP